MADTLTYIINLQGNATNGVLKLQGAATKTATAMEALRNKVNFLSNLGFAIQHAASLYNRLSGAINKCVQAYEEESVAVKKLETLMRNNIGATGEQIQSILDLTSAQQKLGVVGDETQIAGAQELSTYISKTESLKKLIPAMNDMLAQQYGLNATQEQAVGIAQMMGKVLDGQTGALSRYGYHFSEAQAKVLKFGAEEEKVSMLSSILTKYVGGVNAALASTPEGKWKQHQNAVGDLMERIGKMIIAVRNTLMPVFEAISGITERITAFFEKNAAAIEKVGALLGGAVVIALNVISGTLGVIWNIVSGLFGTMADYFPYILGASAVFLAYWATINRQFIIFSVRFYAYHAGVKIITLATKLWAAATKSVFGALGLIVGAVTVAVSLFKMFGRGQNEASKAVNSVAAKIGIETGNLNKLFEAMKKTEPASRRRQELIDRLNSKYPALLKNQNLYRASIDGIAAAQKEANKALASSIFLQDYQQKEGVAIAAINKAKQDFWEAAGGEFSENTIKEVINKIEKSAIGVINSGGESINANEYIQWEKTWYKGRNDETYNLINKLDSNWTGLWGGEYKNLLNTVFNQQLVLKKLKDFGMGYLGVSQDLMNSVNSGIFGGEGNISSPLADPLQNTNEATATGGARSTTINISMKNMMEAHFNGTTRENRRQVESNLAEAIYRVLGMAETAVS